MKKICFFIVAITFLTIACKAGNNSYTPWNKNKEVNGIKFKKYRYALADNGDTLHLVGLLKQTETIDEVVCDKNWVRINTDGSLKHYKTINETNINGVNLPAGTWVYIKPNYSFYCVFPNDISIQGYYCKGGKGPNGTQTAFYANGKLKHFFPAKDFEIDGNVYKKSNLKGVKLDEMGEPVNL